MLKYDICGVFICVLRFQKNIENRNIKKSYTDYPYWIYIIVRIKHK